MILQENEKESDLEKNKRVRACQFVVKKKKKMGTSDATNALKHFRRSEHHCCINARRRGVNFRKGYILVLTGSRNIEYRSVSASF